MLRAVDRVVMRVPSLPGAVTYYRDVIGLQLLRQDSRLAVFRLRDSSSELLLHVDDDLPAEAVFYLVDDVRDLYARRRELKLTFISPPAQAARGFRAAVKDPFGMVLQLIDRSSGGGGPGEGSANIEDARSTDTLFPGVATKVSPDRDRLVSVYLNIGRTADDLPYTPDFENLYSVYSAGFGEPKPDRAEVWRHLLTVRKAGKLPKLGDARSRPPDVSPEDREMLRQLLGEEIGRRDRLPYSEKFHAVVDKFNSKRIPRISPHHIWRLAATLAK